MSKKPKYEQVWDEYVYKKMVDINPELAQKYRDQNLPLTENTVEATKINKSLEALCAEYIRDNQSSDEPSIREMVAGCRKILRERTSKQYTEEDLSKYFAWLSEVVELVNAGKTADHLKAKRLLAEFTYEGRTEEPYLTLNEKAGEMYEKLHIIANTANENWERIRKLLQRQLGIYQAKFGVSQQNIDEIANRTLHVVLNRDLSVYSNDQIESFCRKVINSFAIKAYKRRLRILNRDTVAYSCLTESYNQIADFDSHDFDRLMDIDSGTGNRPIDKLPVLTLERTQASEREQEKIDIWWGEAKKKVGSRYSLNQIGHDLSISTSILFKLLDGISNITKSNALARGNYQLRKGKRSDTFTTTTTLRIDGDNVFVEKITLTLESSGLAANNIFYEYNPAVKKQIKD